jgi:hypothetical protein
MISIARRGLLLCAVSLFASCGKAPTRAPPVIEPISPCETLVLKVGDLNGLLRAPITRASPARS